MTIINVSGGETSPRITVAPSDVVPKFTVQQHPDGDVVVSDQPGDTTHIAAQPALGAAVSVLGTQRGLQGVQGIQGVQGVPGPPGPIQLYDDNDPLPAETLKPYLRFERDGDGDIQGIYLGTDT